MENCTIYSHRLEFDKVVNIVKSSLPKAKIDCNDGGIQKAIVATIKGGLFGKTKTLTINYRERENPSYKLDQVECGLTENLSGMVNFIQSLPSDNIEVKNKFLYKVMSVNCEMPFIAEPEINAEFKLILQKIVTELDGYIFAQPNQVFNQSSGQHFVDKNLDLIIDSSGHCKITDIDVNVDAKYHDEQKEKYSNEQTSRKEASEIILNNKGIKVNTNLPCTPSLDDTILRDKNEVIDRAYSLLIIAALGEGVKLEQLKKPIEDKGINAFSPKELSILNTENLNDQEKAYATWRYESLNTMLWSLNIIPELKYPNEICDVQTLVSKILQPTRGEIENNATLRTKDEILNELDKTYRMHWSCVDARIKNEQVGGNINPSIIYERHYSLNWLTGYLNQEWDDVQTNT